MLAVWTPLVVTCAHAMMVIMVMDSTVVVSCQYQCMTTDYPFEFHIIIDINECLSHPCDSNATCLNTIGSFICTCNEGFTGDGSQCDGESLINSVTLRLL